MNATAPASVDPGAVSTEDASRARWYALFAELFRAPPSHEWLEAIGAQAGDEPADSADHESPLARAWLAFARACSQADARAVREEYETTFIGVGKAEIFLYASFYLSGFLHERPLAELREHMAALGLSRRSDTSETEDHLAALCETMAWLIVAAPEAVRTVATQRIFFSRFLSPWNETLVDAIEHSGSTDFYKHAARLLREFFAIERQAFDFESLD